MVKILSIRDEVYERLRQLKRDGDSFSDVIVRLLDQREERISNDKVLHLLHSILERLDGVENGVEALRAVVSATPVALSGISPPATPVASSRKREKNLPSFLQDNPWVEILAERR